MGYFGQYNERFTIVDVNGVILSANGELVVREPSGFDETSFKFIRDEDYRAFNTEYSDTDVTIYFDRNKSDGETQSGYELIQSILNSAGFDALINFRAYRTPNGGSEEFREWKITGFKELDYAYETRLKRVRYNDKLRTRLDLGIDAESNTNLDDDDDTPLVLLDKPFHSRLIELKTITEIYYFRTIDIPVTENTTTILSTYLGGTSTNEIETFDSQLDFVHGDVSSDIINNVNPIYSDIKHKGKIALDISYTGIYYDNTIASSSWTITLTIYIDLYLKSQLISTNVIKTESGSGTSNLLAKSIGYNSIYEIDVEKGYDVYFYTKVEFTSSLGSFSGTASYELQDSELIAIFSSRNNPSLIKGNFIYEVLNKLTQKAIGDESYNPLSSSLLEKEENGAVSDGLGALNFLTTGNKIRQLDNNLVTSIKLILDFVRVRYNAGFAIVTDTGKDYVILEQADHFFKDVEILEITNYETIDIDFNKDLIFNEVELGYGNYGKENEDGTIDGFNTERTYNLPVTSEKKKLSILTEVITYDQELERVRRLELKKDESDESDNLVFAVKFARYNSSNPIDLTDRTDKSLELEFDGLNDLIYINGLYLSGQVTTSETLTVVGLDTFAIDGITFSAENNQTIIESSDVTTKGPFLSGAYDIYFSIDILIPQTSDGFSSITNLFDPKSSYNLHHAPSNILHQWFDFIGGMLNEKGDSEKIKLANRKNNIDVSFSGRDLTSATLAESDDYTLGSLRGYNPTYLNSKRIELVCYLDYDTQLNVILKSLSGEFGASKDWGYITTSDNNGNEVKFYPTEITYDPVTWRTRIIGWGKKV